MVIDTFGNLIQFKIRSTDVIKAEQNKNFHHKIEWNGINTEQNNHASFILKVAGLKLE